MPTNQPPRIILVTGPARSGKSEWAEHLALTCDRSVIYVATSQADPHDAEWQARLRSHQQRRPTHWQTVEAPTDLITVFQSASADQCLLVDSVGTWLANLLMLEHLDWPQTLSQLLVTTQQCPARLLFVAEEVGWGVVPAYPLGRTFRDRLGEAIRALAAIADVTYLVTGGHILNLTQLGTPLAVALKGTTDG
jgi:adenosylcobinamide kinase / adenosylcobinamide-phosphate guanylyltransferase